MASIGKTTIKWGPEDWLADLSPQYGTGVDALPSTADAGVTVMRGVDPFRALGYLSPAPLAETPTNVGDISARLLNVAYGHEGATDYAYMIERGDQLHRLNPSTYTISNTGSWPHTITGTGSIIGSDVVQYSVNVSGTRTQSLLYSYIDDGGAWDVGLFNLSAGTFDDDWFSTTPADAITPSGNSTPHPMIVGRNDIAYVADGNVIYGIDGATGTNATVFTALTLPADFRVTSFAETTQYLCIFGYKHTAGDIILDSPTFGTREARAYFYDYLEIDPVFSVALDDDFVSAGFEFRGTIGCFTGGAEPVRELNGEDRFSRLKLWDGSKFETVCQFIGKPPVHGGTSVANEALQWNTGSNIHSYGSPYEGIRSGHKILYDVSDGSPGMYEILPGGSGYPIASTSDSGNGRLERFRTDFAAIGVYAGPTVTPILGQNEVAKAKSVTVYFGKTMSSAGRAFSLSLLTENGTTTQVVNSLTQVTSDNIVHQVTYDVSGNQLPRFQEMRPLINYSGGSSADDAPVVRYIELEYEVINNNR
jgi:hypothetical protein